MAQEISSRFFVSPHWTTAIIDGEVCIDVDATVRHFFEKGRPFAPGRVVLGGREGRCFTNAARYVRAHPEAQYVEGLAWGDGLIWLHAWAAEGDRTIEVTWPELGAWYWGVGHSICPHALNRF